MLIKAVSFNSKKLFRELLAQKDIDVNFKDILILKTINEINIKLFL